MDYVGHGGGYPGFITYSLLCQQHKLVIVVLSNALNPFPQEIAFGLMDILNVVAANESKLTEPTGIDTAWLDKISGLYTMRWGNSLFQRIGNRMVMATPDVLRPSMAMSIGEQDGRDFRWVSGMQNGVFGESHTVDEQDGKVLLRRGALTLEPFDLDY
jgi:D-alanyl-D-alanine carboxypeptidase